MPLEAPGVTWSETISYITLKVPLKSTKPSGVDIVTSDEYVKVSFPPYLCEIFLYEKIDEQESQLKIENGLATFTLRKRDNQNWGQLAHSLAKDKDFQKRVREDAWEYNKAKEAKQRVERSAEADKQKKMAVKEQIRLEQEERQRLQEMKELEKSIALAQLHEEPSNSEEMKPFQPAKSKEAEKGESKNGNREIFSQEKEKLLEVSLPAPRSSGTIQVKFTPRVFPTPSRESKAPEEEAWLEKVAAMNKIKSHEDAVDMEEMNPIWLKQKGDGFYKQGNFIAAINAYTAAIVLDGSVPSLYSNRAACHLHMKQYTETIQDCFMALELLTPPVPANADARSRAYIRRGTAHFKMENYVEALKDYESALKIAPNNKEVRADADRIRVIIQGTS